MHTEHDLITQYIRALKEAQQQAARAGISIADATLVLMPASQYFPTKNEKWEELGKSSQTWDKLKGLYKKADKQAMVNRQAAVRRDQCAVLTAWPRLQPHGKQGCMDWSKTIPP